MSNRRTFLKQALVAGGAIGLGSAAHALPAQGEVVKGPKGPVRVIFLVSDGMSTGVFSLAETFSRLARSKGTSFHGMLEDRSVTHGFFETHSLNSMVTDSAAASTAWGSGSRVFNGAINTLPDGSEMTPIMRLVKDAGFGTGLVTTATATHATPAGFAAVQASRGDEADIATQYLGVVDVVMGGGLEFFSGTERKDQTDLFDSYRSASYAVVRDRTELGTLAEARKALGIFAKGHLPYTLDHQNDPALKASIPTLAEMTESALAILEREEKGFLLQVEGARIDHAAHANDAAAILWDQLAFDDAVGVALEFQKRHPETLIVVTSDHGNSNPGLNGIGKAYVDSTKAFEVVQRAKASFGLVRDRLQAEAAGDPAKTAAIIESMIGVKVTDSEAVLLAAAAVSNEAPSLNGQHTSFVGALGDILGNYNGIWWTSTTHTQDYTVIAAKGPGQEAFSGLHRNTEAFRILTTMFGVDHINPSLTPDEAKQYLSAAPRSSEADWA